MNQCTCFFVLFGSCFMLFFCFLLPRGRVVLVCSARDNGAMVPWVYRPYYTSPTIGKPAWGFRNNSC